MGSAHLPALAAAIVLSLTILPVVAADVLLPLPNVEIPPIKGKTGSFDIMEIDQAAHLLYLADRTTAGVDIFNIKTPAARYVQTINTGSPPNGVSLAKNVNMLFAGTNDSNVVIIDIAPSSPTRNTVVARLNTGGTKRVDEMDYDPVDKKLYAANSDDGIVTVVDAVRNMIIKKFDNMGEGLEQPRYNPSDSMMYLTSSDQNAVFQFDPRSDAPVKKVTVQPERPGDQPVHESGAAGLLEQEDTHDRLVGPHGGAGDYDVSRRRRRRCCDLRCQDEPLLLRRGQLPQRRGPGGLQRLARAVDCERADGGGQPHRGVRRERIGLSTPSTSSRGRQG